MAPGWNDSPSTGRAPAPSKERGRRPAGRPDSISQRAPRPRRRGRAGKMAAPVSPLVTARCLLRASVRRGARLIPVRAAALRRGQCRRGRGSLAPQPAVPAAGRREGERQVAGARRSEGGRQGSAVWSGRGGWRAPSPGGSPLRRRWGRAEGGGFPGLARAGRAEQAAVAGTRSGPAVLACPARVLMFPRSSRPGAACPPGPAPRPRAARPGAGSLLPAPPGRERPRGFQR